MKRLRKSNTVSWANGSSLCQVRLFASEDCPSLVGNDGQDSLRIKSKNLQYFKINHFNELPPGFERPNSTHIGRVPWNCAPKFGLSCNWNVVAGEESQEVKVQELRESRVFEAFYPSSAVIPANSSVSLDVECEFYDDSLTPTIPIIPIEEEEETENVPRLSEATPDSLNSQPSSMNKALLTSNIPNSAKCNAPAQQAEPAPGLLPDRNTCLVTAAAIAVMKSKEQGSLVDTDLLIKILSDPKMVSKLTKDIPKSTIRAVEQLAVSKPVTQLAPPSFPNTGSGSATLPPGRNLANPLRGSQPPSTTSSWPKPAVAAERDPVRVSGTISIAKQVQTNLNTAPSLESTVAKYVGTNPNPFVGSGLLPNQPKTMTQTCVKDINYIKNLIREHGTDKTQDPTTAQDIHYLDNMRLRKVTPKFHKACMYFKSPMGCRKGSDCPYQHDISYQLQTGITSEAPQLKRMRLSGEINW